VSQMTDTPVTSGGEHANARRAMEDLVRRAVNEGIPAKRAEEMARKAARDYDRQNKK
jgi:hypothetical protein